MMTTTPARMAVPRVGPFGMMFAAIEGFSHTLAAEVGARGVRVACLLSSGSPETPGVQGVFELHARAAGTTGPEFEQSLAKRTLLGRMTTLDEVAKVAAFIASDRASAITEHRST
jgi:NAD(P)-dependent dehydrogenase (short-subunit alcohol dehydrogenase family)